MAGASGQSLRDLVEAFDQRWAADASTTTAEELFSVVGVLDADGALRRGLTDPSRQPEQRRGIAATVLEGRVYPVVRELVAYAAGLRWSAERDLADALEHLGAVAAAAVAARRGGQEAVTEVAEDLLRFVAVVQEDPRIQSALTDARASEQARRRLAERICPVRSEEARLLIDQAAAHPRGQSPDAVAQRFADALVHLMRRSIAKVTVSQPLDESRRQRLTRALSRVYGRELILDVVVDPQILGGLKVQVGDEVIDGSMAARLADLDRTVTAS